jgi:hypothetical protein
MRVLACEFISHRIGRPLSRCISTETSPKGLVRYSIERSDSKHTPWSAVTLMCRPGNNLFHKARDGAAWQPGQTDWEDLGGDCTSDPAVATWGAQSARRLRHGSGEQCVP